MYVYHHLPIPSISLRPGVLGGGEGRNPPWTPSRSIKKPILGYLLKSSPPPGKNRKPGLISLHNF